MKQQQRNKLIQELEDFSKGESSSITGNPTQVYFESLSINELRFLLRTVNIDCEIKNPEELVSYLKTHIEENYDKNIIY